MRAREVCVHAVDLGAGITFGDLPADFTAALLTDVVRKRAGAGEGPELAAWLTGRAPAAPKLAAGRMTGWPRGALCPAPGVPGTALHYSVTGRSPLEEFLRFGSALRFRASMPTTAPTSR